MQTNWIASPRSVESALRWAVETGIDVVNVGVKIDASDKDGERLLAASEEATRAGVLTVVPMDSCLGAAGQPGLLRVDAANLAGNYDYHLDSAAAVVLARGDRQLVRWLDETEMVTSAALATAHAAAILALILEAYPGASWDDLVEILAANSMTQVPSRVQGKGVSFPGPVPGPRRTIQLADLHDQGDLDWLGSAVLFPFNKEMHAFVRADDLLRFDLAGVVDVPGSVNVGRDSGSIIGIEPTGMLVEAELEESLAGADSIIVGYLDQVGRITGRDALGEVVSTAERLGRNLYSFLPFEAHHMPQVCRMRERGLHAVAPVVTRAEFERILRSFKWSTRLEMPTIGVFGTGRSQGKFTAQLALRRELLRLGYQVGQLGTEHQSALFGFDYTFPIGYGGHVSAQVPLDSYAVLLQSVLVGIQATAPHLCIVGAQSGVIPHPRGSKSPGFTIHTLAQLLGTRPHAFILAVNHDDDDQYIQQTLDTLHALGLGRTVALVFSDQRRVRTERLGRAFTHHKEMTTEEVHDAAARLEQRFGLPAMEASSTPGARRLTATVVEWLVAGKVYN